MDSKITSLSAVCANPTAPFQKCLKLLCHTLEMSGHGVPWFMVCGTVLALYLATGEAMFWIYSLNLLSILVADIAFVAPIKLFFQRPRPQINKGSIPLSLSSIDSYAFPSGHASRCVALAAYFCYMPPFHLRTHLWYMWALVVSLSRVLLGRHHVTDVVAGVLSGLVVFELLRRTLIILPY